MHSISSIPYTGSVPECSDTSHYHDQMRRNSIDVFFATLFFWLLVFTLGAMLYLCLGVGGGSKKRRRREGYGTFEEQRRRHSSIENRFWKDRLDGLRYEEEGRLPPRSFRSMKYGRGMKGYGGVSRVEKAEKCNCELCL